MTESGHGHVKTEIGVGVTGTVSRSARRRARTCSSARLDRLRAASERRTRRRTMICSAAGPDIDPSRTEPDHVNSNQERTLGLDVPVPVPVPVPALVPAHPRAEDAGGLDSNGYELRARGTSASNPSR